MRSPDLQHTSDVIASAAALADVPSRDAADGSRFRPDIQGLRAIAVLSVVAHHAGRDLLRGGFVGVDIFFVISGYLIAGILLKEIAQGTFSLIGFYERRIRRLFPALFTMLACVLGAAAFLLPSEAYRELGETAVSTIFFVSNITFSHMTGYFHSDARFRPLLHTWSLAVEEQFYLAFPLALFALATIARKRLRLILALGAVISLGLCEWVLGRYPEEAFYLAPFRGYELLMGAALAGLVFPRERPIARDALSLLGLGMIAASLLLLESTTFPGVAALLPCGGTALLLLAGSRGPSVGGRLISTPLFLFFGGLSYSLYLWHWPVLVLGRSIVLDEPTPMQTVLLLLIALVAATISWRWIEAPFLKRRGSRLRVIAYGGAAMAAGACVAVSITLSGGFPARFNAEARRMFAGKNDYNHARDRCHNFLEKLKPYETNCSFGADGASPRVAIWSDSHGAELAVTLGERLAQRGEAIMEITSSGCPPALDYSRHGTPLCAAQNADTLRALVRDKRIDTVVVAVDFAAYPREDWPRLFDGLARSLDAITAAHKRIVLVYPIPVFNYDVPAALGLLVQRRQDPAAYALSAAAFDADNREAVEFLDRERARTGAIAFHPDRFLCDAHRCYAFRPERGVLYFNRDHLSLTGARLLAEHFPLRPAADRGTAITPANYH